MLKKIHHIGVVVENADEAMKFYRDALGMDVLSKLRFTQDGGVLRLQAAAP